MIKLFYKLFNHDKIDDMQRTIDIYRERNQQLEKENMEYKGYKLKYEVTKLYVEDDDALLELFDIAKKHDTEMINRQALLSDRQRAMAQQQNPFGNLGIGNALSGQSAGGMSTGLFGGRFI